MYLNVTTIKLIKSNKNSLLIVEKHSTIESWVDNDCNWSQYIEDFYSILSTIETHF